MFNGDAVRLVEEWRVAVADLEIWSKDFFREIAGMIVFEEAIS